MKLPNIGLFRLLILMVAMVMVLAIACGGDDDGDGDGDPTDLRAETATPSADDDGLSDIPEDTTGITDTEILIGTHMPLTESTAALFGNQIVPGMVAYFDYINDTQGGVHGRKIRLSVGDDHYLPSDTNTVVRKLVEQDGVFAIVGGLGTAQHTAVFEYLKENYIPDLFVATGASLFTEPISRTTFGYNPNYIQEGNAIGRYIAETYPDAKVGMLIQNDDFGNDGKDGVESGLEGSNASITSTETYEAVNSDMTAQVQRLRNDGVDVVVGYTLPLQSGSLISVARATLEWDVPIIISGVSADPIVIALAGGGEVAEGVVTVAYLTPTNQTDHPGIQKHTEIMAQYAGGVDATNLSLFGQSLAELTVKVLDDAGQDLNRRSVIAAAEQVRDFLCSICLGTINLSPTDHRPIETFSLAIAEGDSWVLFGDLVSYESTP